MSPLNQSTQKLIQSDLIRWYIVCESKLFNYYPDHMGFKLVKLCPTHLVTLGNYLIGLRELFLFMFNKRSGSEVLLLQLFKPKKCQMLLVD